MGSCFRGWPQGFSRAPREWDCQEHRVLGSLHHGPCGWTTSCRPVIHAGTPGLPHLVAAVIHGAVSAVQASLELLLPVLQGHTQKWGCRVLGASGGAARVFHRASRLEEKVAWWDHRRLGPILTLCFCCREPHGEASWSQDHPPDSARPAAQHRVTEAPSREAEETPRGAWVVCRRPGPHLPDPGAAAAGALRSGSPQPQVRLTPGCGGGDFQKAPRLQVRISTTGTSRTRTLHSGPGSRPETGRPAVCPRQALWSVPGASARCPSRHTRPRARLCHSCLECLSLARPAASRQRPRPRFGLPPAAQQPCPQGSGLPTAASDSQPQVAVVQSPVVSVSATPCGIAAP